MLDLVEGVYILGRASLRLGGLPTGSNLVPFCGLYIFRVL